MEIVRGIPNPLRGERVVAVAPRPSMIVDAGWRSRLNLYGGRALSAQALQLEQESRAGRLAKRGQTLSPGIVQGLELAMESVEGSVPHLVIGAGMGLCASGDDVVLPLPLRVAVGALPVFATHPEDSVYDSTLDELRAAGEVSENFTAFIVRLRPVLLPLSRRFDHEYACGDDDEANDAFEDLQLADAALLELVRFPTETIPMPPLPDTPAVKSLYRLRNRLAWTIFDAEADLSAGTLMPWADQGVALGVVVVAPGNDGTGNQPLFVDRFSVVRAGGRPRYRNSVFEKGGDPFLWQARMEQFAEQLADPSFATLQISMRADVLETLPPAGLLLRDTVDFQESAAPAQHAFPASWQIEVTPIPIEQLDVALEAAASLAPLRRAHFDDAEAQPEAVRLYIPIPGDLWDPHLLQTESIDPAFDASLQTFRARRDLLLARRHWLRQRLALLSKALDGRTIDFPPDPASGDAEPADQSLPPLPDDDPEQHYGVDTIGDELDVTALRNLEADLTGTFGEKLVTSTEDDGLNLRKVGLISYLARLKLEIDRADDHIDLGFARLHTDIYRIRQMVLGKDVADKLVTNSALAAIVENETSSYVTSKLLGEYVAKLKTLDVIHEIAPVGPSAPVEPLAPVESEAPEAETLVGTMATGVFFRSTDLGSTFTPTSSTFVRAGRSVTGGSALAGGSTFLVEPGTNIGAFIGAGGTSVLGPGVVDRIDISGAITPIGGAGVPPSVIETGGFKFIPEIDASISDIAGQLPISGSAPMLHELTIGERLRVASSDLANQSTKFTHSEIVKTLGASPLFAGMDAPYIKEYVDGKPKFDTAKIDKIEVDLVLGLTPTTPDDTSLFNASINSIDVSVATLRAGEARLIRFRNALQRAQETLVKIQFEYSAASGRHSTVARDLAEARHDIAVCIALTAEENNRIDALNARRRQVLRDEVRFVAYARPRTLAAISLASAQPLHPAIMTTSVPACLNGSESAPPELRALVGVLRTTPLYWQPRILPLLDRLDRIELLNQVMLTSVARVQNPVLSKTPTPPVRFTNPYEQGIWRAIQAQSQVAVQGTQLLARSGWSGTGNRTWKQVRDIVATYASVDDLAYAHHGYTYIGPEALRELDEIARVAACLYRRFGEAPPLLRLRWSETLSQYDNALNLRDLSALPGWASLEADDRVALQEMTNWLHASVDATIPQAVALINDLIRVCILLASHAPVDQLIHAKVITSATLYVDSVIKIEADLQPIRIGAPVFLYDRYDHQKVLGRGIIEDLLGNQASLRIQQLINPGVPVDTSTPIAVTMSGLPGLNAKFVQDFALPGGF